MPDPKEPQAPTRKLRRISVFFAQGAAQEFQLFEEEGDSVVFDKGKNTLVITHGTDPTLTETIYLDTVCFKRDRTMMVKARPSKSGSDSEVTAR